MSDGIKAPIRLLCNGRVNPVQIFGNIPELGWSHDGFGIETGYRILVASCLEALQSNSGDMWDSGHVWQKDLDGSNRKGMALYSGKPFKPNKEYYWKVMTWDENGYSPFSDTASFKTSVDLKDAREEAVGIVFGEKLETLYHKSLWSIQNRIYEDGYCPESLADGYQGQYVRGSSAAVLALLEVGDYNGARMVIRYLCKKIMDMGVERAPHFFLRDNSFICMEDQVDGHYHLIFAWAKYIMETGDADTEYEFYPMLKIFVSYYLNSIYYNEKLKLLWCPSFEHARRNIFMSDYDLLVNVFAIEAIKLMIPIADRHGDGEEAKLWENYVNEISRGISENLSTERDSLKIYGELRLKETPDDLLFGMSFVNLSPISADSSIARTEIMENTMTVYERQASFLWGSYRVLFTNSSPGRVEQGIHKANWQVIGKGLAWEMLYNAANNQWNRLHILQDWLQKYNTTEIFGEAFNYIPYASKKNYIQDAGNLEQTAWFVWAQSKVRKLLRS